MGGGMTGDGGVVCWLARREAYTMRSERRHVGAAPDCDGRPTISGENWGEDEGRSGGVDAPHLQRRSRPATAARLRENGFSAARWDQAEPLADKHDELRHVRMVLEDGGVRIAQTATRNRDLVSEDEGQRQQGIREMQAACRGARVLNSVNLYVRPGSLNPAGSWTPHPENTRVSTMERLVDLVARDQQGGGRRRGAAGVGGGRPCRRCRRRRRCGT